QAPTTAPACRIAHSLSDLASFRFACWVPDHNAPGFHIPHRYRPCTNDRAFANCHAGPHERVCTNPGFWADHNRRTQQRKIRFRVIVCSCANMSTVRNCYACPKLNLAEIENERVLANRAFISRLEVPWEINCRRRIYVNAATNLCSKTAEQKSSPSKKGPWTEPKKRLGERPEHPANDLTRGVLPGAAILLNVQHTKDTDYGLHDYGTATL